MSRRWGILTDMKTKPTGISDAAAVTGESAFTKRGRQMTTLTAGEVGEIVPSVIGWHAGQGQIAGDLINDDEASAWNQAT